MTTSGRLRLAGIADDLERSRVRHPRSDSIKPLTGRLVVRDLRSFSGKEAESKGKATWVCVMPLVQILRVICTRRVSFTLADRKNDRPSTDLSRERSSASMSVATERAAARFSFLIVLFLRIQMPRPSRVSYWKGKTEGSRERT